MKVAGVITEYNPFHNGHKYQLTQIRKQTSADYIIAVMSGDFVQRGQPAITDKYNRARMALECGADLILEMPAVCATDSAERFAAGGVCILKNTGVVDTLCYGVESVDHDMSKSVAALLKNPPAGYSESISRYMQNGMNYPAARAHALCDFTDTNSGKMSQIDADALADFISLPNNILAIEYEKALIDTGITGFPIQRIGEGYHSVNTDTRLASATAIRQLLDSSEDIHDGKALTGLMPDNCARIMTGCYKNNNIVFSDDISDMLYYKLLSEKEYGFEKYCDCTPELSAKIVKNIYKYEKFTQFCALLKSKNFTYTRISRVLIHILLNIGTDDSATFLAKPYLRILGFRKSSSPLLHELKKRASAPIITKVADAPYDLIANDIFAADVYSRLTGASRNEFTQPIVIV